MVCLTGNAPCRHVGRDKGECTCLSPTSPLCGPTYASVASAYRARKCFAGSEPPSFSGVQRSSRALACSIGIGFALVDDQRRRPCAWRCPRAARRRCRGRLAFSSERRRALSLGCLPPGCADAWRRASSISSSETSMPSASTTAASTASRRSARSASGSDSVTSSSSVLSDHLRGTARGRAPAAGGGGRSRATSRAPWRAPARAARRPGVGGHGVHGGLAELALDRRPPAPGAGACAGPRVSSSSESKPPASMARSSSSSGSRFSLTSLTATAKAAVLAGQVLGLVVVGEGDLHLALLAGAGAHELLLEAGDQPARSRARAGSRGRRRPRTARRRRAHEVDDHVVAARRPRARRSRARRATRAGARARRPRPPRPPRARGGPASTPW